MGGDWGGTPIAQAGAGEIDVLGTLLCGGLIVLAVVAVIMLVVRRGRQTPAGQQPEAPGAPDPYREVPTSRLATDANALLVATDDAVKTSEEELGFAAAQYGKPATADFEAALAGARQEISQAFHPRTWPPAGPPSARPIPRPRPGWPPRWQRPSRWTPRYAGRSARPAAAGGGLPGGRAGSGRVGR